MTRHFVALVIIPLVGNVDTLLAATKCALLGNTELALALGVGSAIQAHARCTPPRRLRPTPEALPEARLSSPRACAHLAAEMSMYSADVQMCHAMLC